ncbi:hypothetical protein FISHEDRAFT_51740, partial [Fistulina hepatica ATCC 64428]
WLPLADDYLSELLRLDGRGDAVAGCVNPTCAGSGVGEYCCLTCFGEGLYCHSCCVELHCSRPLCRIQHWTGVHFVQSSLQRLGLHIQLGHAAWEYCPKPAPAHINFITIHVNGLHHVSVDYCGCERSATAGSLQEQLLHHQWYPATAYEPQTIITMECLRQFHILTLQGKVL